MDRQECTARLKQMLSPTRMHHSLMVAKQARALAVIHGVDPEKAELAGLIHDVCKELSPEEQLHWIKKSAIILDNIVASQPQLWHAIAGSCYIQHEFSIDDMQIISAVRYHTSARKDMTRMDEIIYLADLTSDDRDFPGAASLRETVKQSLKEGMKEALSFIIGDLAARRVPISGDTYLAYNQYITM